jgi:hypothetical protein
MLFVDAIATVILAGLMLVPIVNVIVGGVVGGGLAGPLGGAFGILLAIAVTALETWIADRLGLRDLRQEIVEAPGPVADEAVAAIERTIKTGPPLPRRQSHSGRTANAMRHAASSKKLQHGAVQ